MTRKALILFLAKRLGAMALLLVVLSFVVFSLTYLTPGSPVDLLLGTTRRTPQAVAEIKAKYHLDQPFFAQYWTWVKGVVHGDFGKSVLTTLPVSDQLSARIPTSLFLGLYSFVLVMVFGVGSGLVAGMRRGSAVDRATIGASVVAQSTPAFVTAVLLLYLFSVLWPVFPVAGSGTGFVDRLWHLTLPAVALAGSVVAYLVRHTRAAVMGVVDQDYITFARARGLSPRRILFRYTLRNALIPIVTIAGPIFAGTIVGAVVVESTFSVTGVGSLLISSVQTKDLPMVQGLAMLFAALLVFMNIVADLTYFAVDPRIRFGRS